MRYDVDMIKLINMKNIMSLIIGIVLIAMSQLLISLDPLVYEQMRIPIYLFTILPGTVIILSSIILSKYKKLSMVISVLCIIVFMIGIFRGCVGLGWETSGPFKDIKYYNYILEENGYPNTKILDHFPEEIPEGAVNVKMSYYRGFLQGPKSMKLSMVLDNKEFFEVVKRFNIDERLLFKEKKDIGIDELVEEKGQTKIGIYW